MSIRSRSIGYVLFASLCLSTTPTVIKFGLQADTDPMPLLAFRFVVATAVLWLVMGLTQREAIRIDRAGLLSCGLVAGFNVVSLTGFYYALTYITASLATMIVAFSPMVVLLLLALKGERISQRQLIRLGLALVGVYLLIEPAGSGNLWGILLVFTTVVFYAFHLTTIQWRLSHYPAQTIALYIITIMAVILMGLYLLTNPAWPELSGVGWGVVVYTGLVSTAIARLALFAGLRHIGSGQTSLLTPVETLLTILWAMLFLGERLVLWQWLGGGLVLLSAVLASNRPVADKPAKQWESPISQRLFGDD